MRAARRTAPASRESDRALREFLAAHDGWEASGLYEIQTVQPNVPPHFGTWDLSAISDMDPDVAFYPRLLAVARAYWSTSQAQKVEVLTAPAPVSTSATIRG